MKLRDEQLKIFWGRICQCDLTQYEARVLLAWITDAPDIHAPLSLIAKRTGIKELTNISRAYKGLVKREILLKLENKGGTQGYEVNPEFLGHAQSKHVGLGG